MQVSDIAKSKIYARVLLQQVKLDDLTKIVVPQLINLSSLSSKLIII